MYKYYTKTFDIIRDTDIDEWLNGFWDTTKSASENSYEIVGYAVASDRWLVITIRKWNILLQTEDKENGDN